MSTLMLREAHHQTDVLTTPRYRPRREPAPPNPKLKIVAIIWRFDPLSWSHKMPSLIAGDWAASDRLRLGLASPDQCAGSRACHACICRGRTIMWACSCKRSSRRAARRDDRHADRNEPSAVRESRKSRPALDGSPLVRHGCRRIVFHFRFPERRVRGVSRVDVAECTLDQVPLIPFRPCAGVELPVFARHEYRTWELDKRAVRSAARRWS
jgi:hypothetical protein